MKRHEHILDILGEEGSEIAQRVSKALRFGLQEVQPGQPHTNAQRIAQETRDLLGMYLWAVEEGLLEPLDFSTSALYGLRESKKRKVEQFFEISRRQGTLDA